MSRSVHLIILLRYKMLKVCLGIAARGARVIEACFDTSVSRAYERQAAGADRKPFEYGQVEWKGEV